MFLLYFKALHVVGFVAWFAGLFYLVRIFVYHVEAEQKPQPERKILTDQFMLMEQRVYQIIATPAMVITLVCGAGMLVLNPAYLTLPWMQVKLALLAGLVAYHFYCKRLVNKLERNTNTLSSFQYRLLNEVPTLFLVSIALLAVLKNLLNFGYALAGMVLFGMVLYFAAKAYKSARETREG